MHHETISADDAEFLHVHLAGSGTPILLVHGWTASHAVWSPLVEPLSRHCRLLRLDTRGHEGYLVSVNQEPNVKRHARDVINLLTTSLKDDHDSKP